MNSQMNKKCDTKIVSSGYARNDVICEEHGLHVRSITMRLARETREEHYNDHANDRVVNIYHCTDSDCTAVFADLGLFIEHVSDISREELAERLIVTKQGADRLILPLMTEVINELA